MSEENKLEPSRWSPPDDLAQAYNEGKTTKRLPNGSTASLSWTPEMNNRWWSYDGAISFNSNVPNQPIKHYFNSYLDRYLEIIENSSDGPQLLPYSPRGGNGIMFVPDSEIENELAIISKMEPTGQPWSYCPHDTSILRRPVSLHTMTSWIDSFPAILVSHDGRIILDEQYDHTSMNTSGYAISEIMETDDQREFYVDRLFQSLYLYLRHSPKESWEQLITNDEWPPREESDAEQARANAMLKLVDSKRIELVKKPRCAKLRNLKEWILTLPSWASIIISARLANAGSSSLSLIAGDSDSNRIMMNDAYYRANVANRCYNLLVLANEKIYNNGKNMSYEGLALEYGPCWLMQSLISLDRSQYDTPTSLDLVHNNDHWETSINHDRVIAACKLAGAMNAPIELWPRFYSILENLGEPALDEITILIALATPINEWGNLSRTLAVTRGQDKLIREACYLITAEIIWKYALKIRIINNIDDIDLAIMETLSPARPIASQIVDLSMLLDDTFNNWSSDLIPNKSFINPFIDYSMKLITDKPIMTGTINGVSLIASDLNSLNINEN